MPEICASSLLQDDFISAIPSAPPTYEGLQKVGPLSPSPKSIWPRQPPLARVGEIRGYFGELTDVDVHYHCEDSCVR